MSFREAQSAALDSNANRYCWRVVADAFKEDAMGLIGLVTVLGMFCVLLWYCAIYALPVFVGFSTGWWALNHGAGIGCLVVGLMAGVAVRLVGQFALASSIPLLRLVGIAGFVIPAAWAGFGIVEALDPVVSPLWRDVFSALGAAGVAVATYLRLATLHNGLVN
jgi:hypothetical protein